MPYTKRAPITFRRVLRALSKEREDQQARPSSESPGHSSQAAKERLTRLIAQIDGLGPASEYLVEQPTKKLDQLRAQRKRAESGVNRTRMI